MSSKNWKRPPRSDLYLSAIADGGEIQENCQRTLQNNTIAALNTKYNTQVIITEILRPDGTPTRYAFCSDCFTAPDLTKPRCFLILDQKNRFKSDNLDYHLKRWHTEVNFQF